MKTTEEKKNWVRSNWTRLKQKGILKEAISRAWTEDELLRYTLEDIIDLEESLSLVH